MGLNVLMGSPLSHLWERGRGEGIEVHIATCLGLKRRPAPPTPLPHAGEGSLQTYRKGMDSDIFGLGRQTSQGTYSVHKTCLHGKGMTTTISSIEAILVDLPTIRAH